MSHEIHKITPDCRPVFPCWLWHKAAGIWDKYFAFPTTVLGRNNPKFTHWHPDQPTAPTCTPTEGEKLPCGYCGGTDHPSGACDRPELKYPKPQPTHSAQEAAERAANGPTLTKAHALTADRIMTLVTENLASVPTTVEAISEMLHDPALSEAVALEIEEHEHRHFPSTSTQSQQPPVAPGSGEAMRAELIRFQEYAFGMERALRGARASGTASELSLVRAECAELRFQNSQLRERLAQPATPPLPSGENRIEIAAKYLDKKADDYAHEHGSYDPDTGGTEFGRAGEDYYNTLRELAEEIRKLNQPKK